MQIQYLGHSCFLITAASGEKLLFDPFISGNELAKGKVSIEKVQPDYIFLSHAHSDHIADAETISRQFEAPIIGVWEIHEYFSKKELPTVPMNVGGTWRSPKFAPEKKPKSEGMPEPERKPASEEKSESKSKLWVKLVPAIHSSSFPDGSYGGVAVGFVISDGKHTVYYAGDTALSLEMELIAERYELDLVFLPIGGTFTMDVEDAVEAAMLLDVAHVVGMHYDTFPPIKIDHEKARRTFQEYDVTLHLLEIGKECNLEELVKEGAPATKQ